MFSEKESAPQGLIKDKATGRKESKKQVTKLTTYV